MAQAAAGADLIVTAGLGSDAGLTARAAECGGVPAVPIPAALPPGNMDQKGRHGTALTQALAALFTAGSTLASRTVPPMRAAEEAGPSGPGPAGAVSCGGAETRPVR